MAAAAFLIGTAVGMVGYVWVTAPERAQARRKLARAQLRADSAIYIAATVEAERDYWRSKYHEGVGRLISEVRADRESVVNAEDTPMFDALSFQAWEEELG